MLKGHQSTRYSEQLCFHSIQFQLMKTVVFPIEWEYDRFPSNIGILRSIPARNHRHLEWMDELTSSMVVCW